MGSFPSIPTAGLPSWRIASSDDTRRVSLVEAIAAASSKHAIVLATHKKNLAALEWSREFSHPALQQTTPYQVSAIITSPLVSSAHQVHPVAATLAIIAGAFIQLSALPCALTETACRNTTLDPGPFIQATSASHEELLAIGLELRNLKGELSAIDAVAAAAVTAAAASTMLEESL